MPNLSDFLFSPWNVIKTLFWDSTPAKPPLENVVESLATQAPTHATDAAAAAGNVVQAHTAPPDSLCYSQNVGDQILSVCQIMGYEMPSFVLWASLLIFGIFVFTCVNLLRQCSQLSMSFSRLAAQIKKLPQGDQLTAIRTLMAKNGFTAPAWRKFEESLIISTQGDEVFTSVSVDDAFPKSSLIDENVNGAFFSAVPGILTGLGLLMTFIAILDGLSHVSVTANMDVKGIGGLINGLSGKFVSSIVAVTCAVCFVFVERIAYSQPHQGYRKLVNALGARFKRKTAEHLLYQLQKELVTQATLQRELTQTIAQISTAQNRSETSHGRR